MIGMMNKQEENETTLMIERDVMKNTNRYAFDEMFEEGLNRLIEEQMNYECAFIENAIVDIEKSEEITYQIRNFKSDLIAELPYNDYGEGFDELNSELYDDFEFRQAMHEQLMFEKHEFVEYVSEYELTIECEEYENTNGYAFDEYELEYEASLEKLIEEQSFYENRFLNASHFEIEKSDEFDCQIDSYEIKEYDYSDFEDYFDYDFEEEYFFEEIDMEGVYVAGELRGYVADEDPFDSLDGDPLENYWN